MTCCFPFADKPRVYQGVRVKTTVKELLQRHRAREASSKKVKTVTLTPVFSHLALLSSLVSQSTREKHTRVRAKAIKLPLTALSVEVKTTSRHTGVFKS